MLIWRERGGSKSGKWVQWNSEGLICIFSGKLNVVHIHVDSESWATEIYNAVRINNEWLRFRFF